MVSDQQQTTRAPEDDPHQPTNLPADIDERAYRVFRHTVERSGSGHSEYAKPMREEGGNDYALMLDLMGIDEPGTVWRYRDRTHVTVRTFTRRVKWPNGAYDAMGVEAVDIDDGSVERFAPGDEHGSPLALFEAHQYGRLTVIGHVDDLLDALDD